MDGTLNDNSDIDEKWTVELAIPFEAILKRNNKGVQSGDYWRMNFSRVHWDREFVDGKYLRLRDENDKLKKEYNWVWSNQGAINMHQPEMWGYVMFTDKEPYPDVGFDRPDDYLDKQVAFACFRMMRQKEWKYLKKKEAGFQQMFDTKLDDVEYIIKYVKTNGGFEYVIKNITSARIYVIDQNGWLKEM